MIDGVNATNETANYGYPKFVASDKPSWLGDWNNTMDAIDGDIHALAEANASEEQATTELAGRVTEVEGWIGDGTEGTNSYKLNELYDDVEKETNGLMKRMQTAESDLATQNESILSLSNTRAGKDDTTDTVLNMSVDGNGKYVVVSQAPVTCKPCMLKVKIHGDFTTDLANLPNTFGVGQVVGSGADGVVRALPTLAGKVTKDSSYTYAEFVFVNVDNVYNLETIESLGIILTNVTVADIDSATLTVVS